MSTHALTPHGRGFRLGTARKLHHGPIRTQPPRGEHRRALGRDPYPAAAEDHGIAAIARDAGFLTPDTIATPQMAAQAGMPLTVLRWLPLFVAGLVAILFFGIGSIVLSVL